MLETQVQLSMIQSAWLLFTRKILDNATAIFESKTPLLLLWRRQESFGKVQACREISSDPKMSPLHRKDRMQETASYCVPFYEQMAQLRQVQVIILLLFLCLFFD